MYVPLRTPIDAIRGVFLTLRTGTETASIVAAIRDDVRRSIPGGFVGTPRTLVEQIEGSLLQERLVSTLSTVFGGLALTLAGIGLFGVLSYTVRLRAREFGVRMALGAQRHQVIWMVLRETLVLIVPAIACGLAVVLALGDYVKSVLFQVSPADPIALGIAAALLLAVGLAAAYLPAQQASGSEPIRALRE